MGRCASLLGMLAVAFGPVVAVAQDAPALNPFGARETREDAVPGYVELSDGSLHAGRVHLTRDARLRIFDESKKQFREVPLTAIARIDCTVTSEWNEKEWRFKENANDEKYFTGHTYPAREYSHTIVLKDGRKIAGPLSGILYVQEDQKEQPDRYLIHKRDKGELDAKLEDLKYVRAVRLGDKALEEARGRMKAASRKKS